MQRIDDKILEELEETSKLTKLLLDEIKDSENDFLTVRMELQNIKNTIESMSSSMKDNDSISVITKVAVLEEKLTAIDDFETRLDELKERVLALEYASTGYKSKLDSESKKEEVISAEKTKARIQKKNEAWKIKTQFILTIIMTIITFVLGYFSSKWK